MSLTARNLAFGHRHGPRFGGISLELAPGGLHFLLGPNGSGKSTLLQALVGILPLQEGELRFNGSRLDTLPRRERALLVAYTPQRLPPAPLTVYETLLLGRTPHVRFTPARRDHLAAERALARLGLEAWRERPLNELSGGERQRVFIGLALTQETPVLLLDEPAGSLDLRGQLEVYDLLQSLGREENKLILAAEHDLNLAARFGQQLLILHQGGILAQGSAEEVLTPDCLRTAYGVETLIRKDAAALQVVPLEIHRPA